MKPRIFISACLVLLQHRLLYESCNWCALVIGDQVMVSIVTFFGGWGWAGREIPKARNHDQAILSSYGT